mmetsp:Transcript_9727/g.59063  ORF Transcript_9727/g.59063 Transcript_9727/m.59063 type:complete len:92 (+) Transcript_9727:891-1166(+)
MFGLLIIYLSQPSNMGGAARRLQVVQCWTDMVLGLIFKLKVGIKRSVDPASCRILLSFFLGLLLDVLRDHAFDEFLLFKQIHLKVGLQHLS